MILNIDFDLKGKQDMHGLCRSNWFFPRIFNNLPPHTRQHYHHQSPRYRGCSESLWWKSLLSFHNLPPLLDGLSWPRRWWWWWWSWYLLAYEWWTIKHVKFMKYVYVKICGLRKLLTAFSSDMPRPFSSLKNAFMKLNILGLQYWPQTIYTSQ